CMANVINSDAFLDGIRNDNMAIIQMIKIIIFINDTPILNIYNLYLHDALPIFSDKLLDLVGLGGKSAADKGKDTRDYLAAAFPELNAWERAGADASSAGMVDAGFENQKELTKMQLDNQKEIAEMQNETQ